jgi:hypothetical protein
MIRGMFKYKPEQIAVMSDADKERITAMLKSASPPFPATSGMGARDYVEVWVVEHRMNAEHRASRRLTVATWVLAFATVALVLATLALAHVTAVHH